MADKKKPPAVHVTPHDDGWAVKRAGGKRASSVHPTQKEAETKGRRTAQNENTELLVHNKQGQIRKRDTSGGKDPHPPKG